MQTLRTHCLEPNRVRLPGQKSREGLWVGRRRVCPRDGRQLLAVSGVAGAVHCCLGFERDLVGKKVGIDAVSPS